MYTFIDRGDRSCTLRPEGTASVVRAVIQHSLLQNGPQRLWYSGPMFRYERPQAGRLRQFHQIGVEMLGLDSPNSDVESIAVAWDLLAHLGLNNLTLQLNTLGTAYERQLYRDSLYTWLHDKKTRLDPDSQRRLETNPLRILDSKNTDTQQLLSEAPTILSVVSDDTKRRFDDVCMGLTFLEIPFTINNRLVRGLDYYSHTAFEITSNELGSQATVCGGGRYDHLAEQLGGPSIPSIGWAIGFERLVLLLSENYHSATNPTVYIIHRGTDFQWSALKLARAIRQRGFKVQLDSSGSGLSKQFKRAYRSQASWAAIFDDTSSDSNSFRIESLNQSEPQAPVRSFTLYDLDPLFNMLKE